MTAMLHKSGSAQWLAGSMKKHKRGSKKKMPKLTYDKTKPHVSTYRLLRK